jgi:hypothetical protein
MLSSCKPSRNEKISSAISGGSPQSKASEKKKDKGAKLLISGEGFHVFSIT